MSHSGNVAAFWARRRNTLFWSLCLLALFGADGNAAAPGDTLPEARWTRAEQIVSTDGYADLAWETTDGSPHNLFLLTERRNGARFSSYVEGRVLRLFRVEPGVYRFSLQACVKQDSGPPECGKKSKNLELEVTDGVLQPALSAAESGAVVGATAADVAGVIGGPDQLRPGLWSNPDRAGHGWSFYWANRLALPESHALYGYDYDLAGIWYTYEAKSRTLEGPPPCGEGGITPDCYWVYEYFRPLAARLKLVRTGAYSYAGGVYITRNGQEVQAGTATVSFGADNTHATVDWSVDFKRQRLQGSDALTFLAGSRTEETSNMTHFAGIWQPSGDDSITVIDDVGAFSEAVEILFADGAGDPTWVQASNDWIPGSASTSLCFYYVFEGYAPDTGGSPLLKNLGCDYAQDATAANRNGLRYFSDFERAKLWAEFTLPAGSPGGGLSIGTETAPLLLEKTASFHRIGYTQPVAGCEIGSSQPTCPVTLTWFTDGDYPRATAFAYNSTTGQRLVVATAPEPAAVDYAYELTATGNWYFELRMGNTATSTLMARSAALAVTEGSLPAPYGLAGQWLDQAAGRFRLSWAHDRVQDVAYYELEESPPGGGTPVVLVVQPGSILNHDVDHGSGPYGDWSYRVRACNSDGQCSAWSSNLSWHLDAPGSNTVAHPWGDNAYGTLTTGRAWNYAMGYHFRPDVDGEVRELGGLFSGSKRVRLFERAGGRLLAETTVQSDNSWQYAPIKPVPVQAGVEYTVAVYLAGRGGSYYRGISLPASFSGVTVLGSTYTYTGSNPLAVPTNEVYSKMYGQADIGFSVVSVPPSNRPPVLEAPADQVSDIGDLVDLGLTASDPDGDAVDCIIEGLPQGLAAAPDCQIGGTVAGPAGAYQVTAVASDGVAQSDPVSFGWKVLPATSAANPATPPPPAAKPDFSIDAASSRTGFTPGEFSVDGQGTANYRVPILTAPGSGGFSPRISLDYNGRLPNDLAGVGWGVGGLSAIGRCPQTPEQDGVAAALGVTLTQDDRFCLDGERLMVVAGEYGADGSEYRKEHDDFTRLRSYGSVGSGPAYFIAWHGDGSFSEYGRTADARAEARGSANPQTVFTWAVNRREDASGNYIEYSYLENASGPVELTIDRVRYTGNGRAGTTPYAEIRFVYDSGRTDVPPAYLAGIAVARSRLLKRIDSLAKAHAGDASMQWLRSYQLTYGQDGYGRRVLEKLQECSDDTQRYCLPPTTFGWLKTEHTVAGPGLPAGQLFSRDFRSLGIADANGDGRPDLLVTEEQRKTFSMRVAFAGADGSFALDSHSYAIPDNGEKGVPVGLLTVDLDGDSRQDVVYPRDSSGRIDWVARRATAAGFADEQVIAAGCCGQTRPKVARIMDFDGDGRPDLLTSRATEQLPGRGELVVLLNEHTPGGPMQLAAPLVLTIDYDAGLFPSGPTQNGWIVDESAPQFLDVVARSAVGAEPFDYNGDGRVDLLARIGRKYVKCSGDCTLAGPVSQTAGSGSGFDFPAADEPVPDGVVSALASFYILFEADGDGRYRQREIVAVGAGMDCSVPQACQPWQDLPAAEEMLPVDVNADGLADLAFRDTTKAWSYLLNTGDGLKPPQPVAQPADDAASVRGWFADINGDGFPEFLYPDAVGNDAADWVVHFNDLGAGFAAAKSSGIRLGNVLEGDGSILQDFSGDGMLDNLFLDFSKGRVNGSTTRLYTGSNLLTGRSQEAATVLREIVDGRGSRIDLEWQPLTDAAVYTRMGDAAAAQWGRGSAVFDLVAPVYVVSQVDSSAPTLTDAAAMRTIEYHYAGGKIQAGGRGFLGFGEVVRWDPQRGIRSHTRYRQDHPLTGVVADSATVRTDAGHRFGLLSDATAGVPPAWPAVSASLPSPAVGDGATLLAYRATGWGSLESGSGKGNWWRYEKATLHREFTLSGAVAKQALGSNSYLSWGRLARNVSLTAAGPGAPVFNTVTTSHEYLAPDTDRWILGQRSATTVTHSRPGLRTQTRSTEFSHDPATGLTLSETVAPGNPELEVRSVWQRDLFGNKVAAAITGAGMATRNGRTEYDSLGRFPVRELNHYGQEVSRVLDWSALGVALLGVDIEGIRTETAVDAMGRAFVAWTESGAWERTLLRGGRGAQCPPGTAWHAEIRGGGKPSRYRCFDVAGQEVRNAVQGFSGEYIYRDRQYDRSGRSSGESEPYFAGDTRYWNMTAYDALDRIVRVDAAGGGSQDRAYAEDVGGRCGVADPLAVRIRNGLGQDRVERYNLLGELAESFDDNCGRTTYDFDAIGNLVAVTGPDGAGVTMDYDGAGRKVRMDDPDKGVYQYAWNALGELQRQLDSRRQAVDFERDALGRLTDRRELVDVDSLGDSLVTVVHHETTAWENGTGAGVQGKSQARSVIYQDGEAGAQIHRVDYEYDAFGRPSAVLTQQNGRQFMRSRTYDQFGRSFQEFDESGDYRGIQYSYNSYGYRVKLSESRDSVQGTVYQQFHALDARGNMLYATLGNGVEVFASYDGASGRLLRLEAYDADGSELQDVDYLFDVLGNLRQRTDGSNGRDRTEDFSYDNLNRLLRVELTAPALGLDVPTQTLGIAYDASGNITWKSDVGSYAYGEGTAGPHAVAAAGAGSYDYDANGNQVSGDGRTIAYSVFDQPLRIERAGQSTSFVYGAGQARIMRVDDNGVDGARTTHYLGRTEYIEDATGSRFRRYLGGTATADYFPATGASSTRYLVRDHQGSVFVVTGEDGRIAGARWMDFDAFGQRRDASWSGLPGLASLQALNDLTNRGFTGHEQLDAVGLVHMNGRIYDPKLGRFLQADPFVQMPRDGQSLNRYAYVFNNPLSLTDPSGYFSLKGFVKRWGRLIVALALSVVLPGPQGILASQFGIGSAYAQAAITGFVAGAVASGTLRGAVIGSLTAIAVQGLVNAFSTTEPVANMARPEQMEPLPGELEALYGPNGPPAGYYRVTVESNGALDSVRAIGEADFVDGDLIFTNGMGNEFADAIRTGSSQLFQSGMLPPSYVLNFNSTQGMVPDLLEASVDVVGAHTGLAQSALARNLAATLHGLSERGVTGIRLVGHSQGGAITASALRYAARSGLNLSSLAGGGVFLHGAPVNDWLMRRFLNRRLGLGLVSRAQFGDAVHVLGGLNIANPLELPVTLWRFPTLFSKDSGLSPHSLPCGGRTVVCAP